MRDLSVIHRWLLAGAAAFAVGACDSEPPSNTPATPAQPTGAPEAPEGSAASEPASAPAEPTPSAVTTELAPRAGEGSGLLADAEPGESGRRYRLEPRHRPGDRFVREVQYHRDTVVRTRRGAHDLSAEMHRAIEATLAIEVVASEKRFATDFEVTFDEVQIEIQGRDDSVGSGVAEGDTWRCTVEAEATHCVATSDGSPRALPPWLPLALGPLMPGEPVTAGEHWTRRTGVAQVFGLPAAAAARAVLTAEPAYDAVGGRRANVTAVLEGDCGVDAFGRQLQMRVSGSGGFEIDLTNRHLAAFDYTWSGSVSGEGGSLSDPYTYDRRVDAAFRMTSTRQP